MSVSYQHRWTPSVFLSAPRGSEPLSKAKAEMFVKMSAILLSVMTAADVNVGVVISTLLTDMNFVNNPNSVPGPLLMQISF